MCKTNVTVYFYYVNICKHEHDKVMMQDRAEDSVEQIEGNEGSYLYLYPFGDLAQGSFQRNFYVCIEYTSFLKTFLIESQL
jgi:hypothetical protein